MISFTRYIRITSGVGGNAAVATRELIARLFTINPLLPTGTIQEFDSADGVGEYFGTTSEEYLRSVFYFGFISKSIENAKKISFCRWADVAVAPTIFGDPDDFLLASFTAVNDATINMTLGIDNNDITGLDFTAQVSLAGVASVIQAGINAQAGAMWTGATVTYNATRKSFDFVGGTAGDAVISVAVQGTGTDLIPLVRWGAGALFSAGAAAQTVTTVLSDSTELNNNFGSFAFQPSLSNDEIVEAATWNDAQNNFFQYHVPVIAANAAALSALVIGYSGIGLTLNPEVAGEYPEMMPMTLLASTDYDRRNSVKNYMFQQFNDITVSVDTNTDADTYDSLRVNFYGVTQTAGQQISFYQSGYLMGGNNDAQDMGVYANEQWFKDACGSIIMELLLALDQVPASRIGSAQVLAVLQTIIDAALFNATIQVGKSLTTIQKLFVSNTTGNPNAWQQVEAIGYWVSAKVVPYVEDTLTKYKITYIVVYAKGDSIRRVEGTNILI